MLQKLTVCILVFFTILAGCTPEAPQAEVYPGKAWTWASSPESLGWSSEKLALARAYCLVAPALSHNVDQFLTQDNVFGREDFFVCLGINSKLHPHDYFV